MEAQNVVVLYKEFLPAAIFSVISFHDQQLLHFRDWTILLELV